MQRNDLNAGLLKEFVETGSETAFARIVREHIHLVYSAALRRCGDRNDLAADICQTVFIDLARKARRIAKSAVLAGWLYQHANFVASNQLREEMRRNARETRAAENSALMDKTDWSRMAPLLDESLMELAPSDRDSLVLRYLEQQPWAKVGDQLGVTENAARMRVDRALDKLRDRLASRGINSTAAALSAAMAGPALVAAPAALTEAVIQAAFTTTALGATSGILAVVASSQMKFVAAALLMASAGSGIFLQHQSTARLRAERDALRSQVVELSQERDRAREDASQGIVTAREAPSAELLRLRGEVARLRSPGAAITMAAPVSTPLPPSREDRTGEPLVVGGVYVPLERLGNAGTTTPEASATTFLWALLSKNPDLFRSLREPLSEELNNYLASTDPRLLDEIVALERTASLLSGVTSARIQSLNPSASNPDGVVVEIEFQHYTGGVSHVSPTLRPTDGIWRVVSPEVPEDHGKPPI